METSVFEYSTGWKQGISMFAFSSLCVCVCVCIPFSLPFVFYGCGWWAGLIAFLLAVSSCPLVLASPFLVAFGML